jgi:hypothetical protein
MRFLMSEELELTVVGAVASVNSTREASRAEEVRYLSGKGGNRTYTRLLRLYLEGLVFRVGVLNCIGLKGLTL